jgi:hypothetical protein
MLNILTALSQRTVGSGYPAYLARRLTQSPLRATVSVGPSNTRAGELLRNLALPFTGLCKVHDFLCEYKSTFKQIIRTLETADYLNKFFIYITRNIKEN